MSKGKIIVDGMEILPQEKIEDLQCSDLRIIQSEDTFRFGFDAVFLADFASVRLGDLILDLGCGNGVIPLLLAGKQKPGMIWGLEIQEKPAAMAQKSVTMNKLDGKIKIVQGDIRTPPEELKPGSFDLVVSNPPYLQAEKKINATQEIAVARHEILCSLSDVNKTAARMLRYKGKFALIHRPGRLPEIFRQLENNKLTPKRIRFIHPNLGKKATMVMVEAVKGGKSHLITEKPLIIYNDKGEYTDEIISIYQG